MHESHVIDTDAVQAPEQNTGRSLTAQAKAAPTVDDLNSADKMLGPDQQQQMLHKLDLRRAGTNCDETILKMKKKKEFTLPAIFATKTYQEEEDLPENQEIHSLEDE